MEENKVTGKAKKLLESNAKLDVKAFLTLQSFVVLGEELFNIK